jgi:hypothetical protein
MSTDDPELVSAASIVTLKGPDEKLISNRGAM